MPHLSIPGPDNGFFTTEEVRPSDEPEQVTSRIIALPKHRYNKPPNIAGGFKSLDLGHRAPGVRANLVGSDITSESFRVTLETWDGGVLYSASAQWIEHKAGSKECHFGQFDTSDVEPPPQLGGGLRRGKSLRVPRKLRVHDSESESVNGSTKGTEYGSKEEPMRVASQKQQEWSKSFRFPVTFEEPPDVVCWLNRLDLASGGGRNWRLAAFVSDVTTKNATFHIDTWGDSILHGAAMCWIAFPKNKRKVDCGNISTTDVRPWYDPRSRNEKRIRFKEGWFKKPPVVLVSLNMLDMAGNADLRVQVDADDVDNEGFTWHLDTWVSVFKNFSVMRLLIQVG